MAKKNKGKEPPAFLSTHPSSSKRIENLRGWIDEVIIDSGTAKGVSQPIIVHSKNKSKTDKTSAA